MPQLASYPSHQRLSSASHTVVAVCFVFFLPFSFSVSALAAIFMYCAELHGRFRTEFELERKGSPTKRLVSMELKSRIEQALECAERRGTNHI
ncbi:hypothetical protein B0H14DRAFT_2820512 [Mycena olivaceomarginata]|nr:hypothetical protein B0H14DRAFT_2820512 [Mycena olivaceomarginata]